MPWTHRTGWPLSIAGWLIPYQWTTSPSPSTSLRSKSLSAWGCCRGRGGSPVWALVWGPLVPPWFGWWGWGSARHGGSGAVAAARLLGRWSGHGCFGPVLGGGAGLRPAMDRPGHRSLHRSACGGAGSGGTRVNAPRAQGGDNRRDHAGSGVINNKGRQVSTPAAPAPPSGGSCL